MAESTETQHYVTFDEAFHVMHYPAGESHIRSTVIIDEIDNDELVIEMQVRGFEQLGQLLTADAMLRRKGIRARWFVPYFPFARHDRRNDSNDGFELGVALEMVRNIDIVLADPHSDVAGQLPHFAQAACVARFAEAGLFADDPVVVIPDAGATKKAHTWIDNGDSVQALKRRDPRTGKLSGFSVDSDDLAGRPCVIVDDICDGGGTFLGLAKVLRQNNAGPLRLAVTHGLFTQGLDELLADFDEIYFLAPTGAVASSTTAVRSIEFKVLYEKGNPQ